jgi:phage terminase large subunit-like protein
MFGKLSPAQIKTLIAELSPAERLALVDDWSLWALPHQRLPPGNWRRWILRAGRGAGKTHAGSNTTHLVARNRKMIRRGEIGIVGRTHDDVRAICVEGPGGILDTAPSDFQPEWQTGHGILTWPNGVRGRVFSGDRPDGIRGANLAFIWCDEAAAWPEGHRAWWETIEPALRIGWARALITTTPRPVQWLRELEAMADTVVTKATTRDNPWLSTSAQTALLRLSGTRIGQQELDGEYLEDTAAAIWRWEMIESNRVATAPHKLDRVVIAVDPAFTSGEDSDETGISVVGLSGGHAYVLVDDSGKWPATTWPRRVIDLYHRWGADRVIAESNVAGELVELALRAVDPNVHYTHVRAKRGKRVRAEPVAALYERGRVHHVGVHPKLERQLVEWTQESTGSPDRMDALVYAITHLLLPSEKPASSLRGYL